MGNKEELKTIFWDYDVGSTSEEIYDFLVGKREIKNLNRDQVIARLLTTMRWYDMIDIFGIKQLYGFLDEEVLKYLWKGSVRTRYKNVRETLQGIL